ncbi:MAG: patatin-like phospholipase family protein [Pseudomonadales bacterium]
MKTGLVLSGGGARGAYQVGVLKAIADLRPKHAHNPFSVISGTSSGAINAVALAASANNFRLAVMKVERIWKNLHVDMVYRSRHRDIAVSMGRLVGSLFNEGIGRRRPVALLNNDPLRDLLSHVIHFKNIQRRIDSGFLEAVAVTATGYTSGESVSFFQGRGDLKKWRRMRRVGVPTELSVGHLLASSAIPTILPAEKISLEYFGDGAMRQLAPISPVLHLGADRLLVIGVSGNPTHPLKRHVENHSPSLAQIVGHIFKSAFIDSLETDLDHLMRINDLVGMVQLENPHADTSPLRTVDLLQINPSIEFDEIAAKHIGDLPHAMRKMMRVTGATGRAGGSSMASYLLFEAEFCQELIACGYRDAMEQEEDIRAFFT